MIRHGFILGSAMLLGGLALNAAPPAASAPASDLAMGQAFFEQRCVMCHANAIGKKATMAPNLNGIANSMSGTSDYAFSAALRNAKIQWSAENLDRFLAAPGKVVPGTRMMVAIPDPAKRAQVVIYLMSLK